MLSHQCRICTYITVLFAVHLRPLYCPPSPPLPTLLRWLQVPLGVTIDPGNIAFALNQTEAAIFVIGQDVMDIAFSLLPKCPHIKYVIVLRRPLDEPKEASVLL